MEYTIDYFIDKYTKIPHKNWVTGILYYKNDLLKERCCVLGHCGVTYNEETDSEIEWNMTEESLALIDLLGLIMPEEITSKLHWTYTINDSGGFRFFNKDHSKDRILMALNKVKEKLNDQ